MRGRERRCSSFDSPDNFSQIGLDRCRRRCACGAACAAKERENRAFRRPRLRARRHAQARPLAVELESRRVCGFFGGSAGSPRAGVAAGRELFGWRGAWRRRARRARHELVGRQGNCKGRRPHDSLSDVPRLAWCRRCRDTGTGGALRGRQRADLRVPRATRWYDFCEQHARPRARRRASLQPDAPNCGEGAGIGSSSNLSAASVSSSFSSHLTFLK